jgi:uncharacterized phage infection (PIP) family protein YhgE
MSFSLEIGLSHHQRLGSSRFCSSSPHRLTRGGTVMTLIRALLVTLELGVAVSLLVLAWQLPGTAEVRSHATQVEAVARAAEAQVRTLRKHASELRRDEVADLAEKLRRQGQSAALFLGNSSLDFEALAALAEALAPLEQSMRSLPSSINQDKIRLVTDALGSTAELLEQIAPAAEKTADQLQHQSQALAEQAQQLRVIISTSAPDLSAARRAYDGLKSFEEGLTGLNEALDADRIRKVADGATAAKDVADRAANDVDRIREVVGGLFKGLRGYSESLRTISTGMEAAAEQMTKTADTMPELQKAINESRQVVRQTRATLGRALEKQKEVEALLKDAPERAGRFAEQLPRLAEELAQVLRGASRLKATAKGLRTAQASIQAAVERWPETATALERAADILVTTRRQINMVLSQREPLDIARREAAELAERLAVLAPAYADQVVARLDEHEHSLAELEGHLDRAAAASPAIGHSIEKVLMAGKAFAFLMACLVAVHALMVGWNDRLSRAVVP